MHRISQYLLRSTAAVTVTLAFGAGMAAAEPLKLVICHVDDRSGSAADTGISKWTLTGTTLDGMKKQVQGCDFYTFRDGKVIRKDSYWKIVE